MHQYFLFLRACKNISFACISMFIYACISLFLHAYISLFIHASKAKIILKPCFSHFSHLHKISWKTTDAIGLHWGKKGQDYTCFLLLQYKFDLMTLVHDCNVENLFRIKMQFIIYSSNLNGMEVTILKGHTHCVISFLSECVCGWGGGSHLQ